MSRLRVARSADTVVLSLLAVAPTTGYQRPGHYTQIDLTNDGRAANGSSSEVSLDASGRYAAFSSTATNLGGGSVPQTVGKYRAASGDLFVRLSLAPGAIERARRSTTVLGIDLDVGGHGYEVRAGSTGFALYDGSRAVSTYLGPVAGGFGTTGEEVVFAIPLHSIGASASARAKLSAVVAFGALGTTTSGPACVLDRVVFG